VHGGVGDAVLWAVLGAGYGWLLRRGAAPPGARVVPGRHRPRMLLRTRARWAGGFARDGWPWWTRPVINRQHRELCNSLSELAGEGFSN